jgi:hypothetical protein
MTCGHLLDNRPEEAIFLLEAALVFGQELTEEAEQRPIKGIPHSGLIA